MQHTFHSHPTGAEFVCRLEYVLREVPVWQRKTARDYACAIYPSPISRRPRRTCLFRTIPMPTPSLFDAFEPAEARWLCELFEFHYTPKHANWLNIAECELSALSRQCLDRRIRDFEPSPNRAPNEAVNAMPPRSSSDGGSPRNMNQSRQTLPFISRRMIY